MVSYAFALDHRSDKFSQSGFYDLWQYPLSENKKALKDFLPGISNRPHTSPNEVSLSALCFVDLSSAYGLEIVFLCIAINKSL